MAHTRHLREANLGALGCSDVLWRVLYSRVGRKYYFRKIGLFSEILKNRKFFQKQTLTQRELLSVSDRERPILLSNLRDNLL